MTLENQRLHLQIAELEAQLAEARAELAGLRVKCSMEDHTINQTLGAALGYPRFCDDLAIFPGATPADGVCVGEHVAATLAAEAAERIGTLTAERDTALAEVERLKAAVQTHHDQAGDDRCHLDDLKLYHEVLGEGVDPYVGALPPDVDMEESCRRYIQQRRCPNGVVALPDDMTIRQLTNALVESRAEVERLNAVIPDRCPITKLEFFCLMEHPDLGWVATYGGEYDSYTIPEVEHTDEGTPLHERGLIRWRYCHDRGCWIEAETIDLRLIREPDLIEVHDELDAKLKERAQSHRERANRISAPGAAGLDEGRVGDGE